MVNSPGFGGSFVKMNPVCQSRDEKAMSESELVGADGITRNIRKMGRAEPVPLLSV